MTDRHTKNLRRGLTTTTTTTTTTETEIGRGIEQLTQEEERVVRMLHGLAEPDSAVLSFAQTPDMEINTRLKLMEAELMAHMHGMGPLAETVQSPRQKILDRLRSLEGDE